MLNPEKILQELDLKENMMVAEFGCGTGHFALLLANKLKQGTVYAIDVQSGPLSAIKSKAEAKGLYNLKTIQADLERVEGSTLGDELLDLVLIPNVLFQAEAPEKIIKEAKRVVKKGERILILDWGAKADFGPKKEQRISKETVKEMAEEMGLVFEKELDAAPFHWGIVFKKP